MQHKNDIKVLWATVKMNIYMDVLSSRLLNLKSILSYLYNKILESECMCPWIALWDLNVLDSRAYIIGNM